MLKKFFVFFLFLFLFDFLFFEKLQFLLPNESPWNSNHFFNFLYEFQLAVQKPKKAKRVIVVGSSIAYFSIQKSLLEKTLSQEISEPVEVEYLSYAGKSPLYVYLMRKKLLELKPDLVVYPINFIDYRLHRGFVLFGGNPQSSWDENLLLRDAVTKEEAPQSFYIFPFETILEFSKILSLEHISSYVLARIFSFYRFRDIWFENVQNLFQHRFGKNNRYHSYMGVPIPERVSTLGWTGEKFSFRVLEAHTKEGFLVEVPNEVLKTGNFQISFFCPKTSESFTWSTSSSGWQKVLLPVSMKDCFVSATLSDTFEPRNATGVLFDYNKMKLGVRLQQTFGLEKPLQNRMYEREERLEDLGYASMSDPEYDEYFYYRLLSDPEKRPGIAYLVALMKTKKLLNQEKFQDLFHFRYLKKLSLFLDDQKIPFLLINNPENPISLEWYEKSPWYQSHLEFLRSLQSNNTQFVDLKNSLRRQDFTDFHHFTYSGMEKMNPIYVKEIRKVWEK